MRSLKMLLSCAYHALPSNQLWAQCSTLPSLRHLRPLSTLTFTPPVATSALPCKANRSSFSIAATPPLAPLFASLHSNKDELLPLSPDDLHVWWLRHKPSADDGLSADLRRACAAELTEEEAAECTSARDPDAGELRLVARAFTRAVLRRYLPPGHETSQLLFSRNQHGKPELAHPPTALRFNLTHTPGLVGVAVAAGRAVGLDVEATERRVRGDALRLAKRRFSRPEIEQLEALEGEDARAAHFIKLWTLKEAYVKAVGSGISAAPGLRGFGFEFRVQAGHEQRPAALKFQSAKTVKAGDEASPEWSFLLLQPTESHLAAVCCENGNGSENSLRLPQLSCFMVDFEAGWEVKACSPAVLAAGTSIDGVHVSGVLNHEP